MDKITCVLIQHMHVYMYYQPYSSLYYLIIKMAAFFYYYYTYIIMMWPLILFMPTYIRKCGLLWPLILFRVH